MIMTWPGGGPVGLGAVGDGEGLDAVDPAGAEADGIAGLGDVRHGVGDGVEDQLDLQLGQAGAQAVVRAQAAVAEVGVRVAADVESSGLVEDLLVEVGRPVEQPSRWPALICWPPSSTSAVAVRWNTVTGVAQRTISSAAVSGRDALNSSHCSGWSRKASMPCVMALRVVSLPATASISTKKPNSSSDSFVPVDLGADQLGDDVVARAAAPLLGHGHAVAEDLDGGHLAGVRLVGNSGRRSRSSGWTSRRSCRGPPAGRRSGRRWPAAAARTPRRRRSRRCRSPARWPRCARRGRSGPGAGCRWPAG